MLAEKQSGKAGEDLLARAGLLKLLRGLGRVRKKPSAGISARLAQDPRGQVSWEPKNSADKVGGGGILDPRELIAQGA